MLTQRIPCAFTVNTFPTEESKKKKKIRYVPTRQMFVLPLRRVVASRRALRGKIKKVQVQQQ